MTRAFERLTAPWRSLPDFLIVGAQHCGTSSLFKHLRAHPSVAAASVKEVHFFDLAFHRGSRWYQSHFPLRRSLSRRRWVATGEASPYYIFHPRAIERIAGMLPEVRLILMLRNPVDRAHSAYRHSSRSGHESLTFEDALAAEPERLEGEAKRIRADPKHPIFNHRVFSYQARGRYAEQIDAALRVVPRDRLLIVESEALFTRPSEALPRLHEFLGISTHGSESFPVTNATTGEPMRPATRAQLSEYFEPHNRRLAELLGEEFSWMRS